MMEGNEGERERTATPHLHSLAHPCEIIACGGSIFWYVSSASVMCKVSSCDVCVRERRVFSSVPAAAALVASHLGASVAHSSQVTQCRSFKICWYVATLPPCVSCTCRVCNAMCECAMAPHDRTHAVAVAECGRWRGRGGGAAAPPRRLSPPENTARSPPPCCARPVYV